MIKLTENEKTLLVAITNSSFYEEGFNSTLWTNVLMDEVSIANKSARGVISSLSKKDLVTVSGEGSESTTQLTEEGRKAVLTLRNDLDSEGYVQSHKMVTKENPVVAIPDSDWMSPSNYKTEAAKEVAKIVSIVEKAEKSKKLPKTNKTHKTEPSARVTLKTFTGMVIGEYEATFVGKLIQVKTLKGIIEFDPTTMKQVNCKNPKFANKIEMR